MPYRYASPALFDGPCIRIDCTPGIIPSSSDVITANNISSYLECASQVVQCTAGAQNASAYFSSPFHYACNYQYYNSTKDPVDQCLYQPLIGTVSGSGSVWSLFDATSTVTLKYETISYTSNTIITELSLTNSNQYTHFLTGEVASVFTASSPGGSSAFAVTAFPTTTTNASTSSTSAASTITSAPSGSSNSASTAAAPTSSSGAAQRGEGSLGFKTTVVLALMCGLAFGL